MKKHKTADEPSLNSTSVNELQCLYHICLAGYEQDFPLLLNHIDYKYSYILQCKTLNMHHNQHKSTAVGRQRDKLLNKKKSSFLHKTVCLFFNKYSSFYDLNTKIKYYVNISRI